MKLLRWALRVATVAIVAGAAWYWLHGPSIEQGSYLVLDVGGTYSEARPGGLLAHLVERRPSLSDFLESLRKARHDGRIAGVVVRLGHLDSGWAQAQEIRGALALAKDAGKKIVAELETEMTPAAKEVYVASVADAVYVAPAAAPMLTGLQASAVFLGGLWPKLDVAMQVEKIREYKTAGDEIGGEAMTPAHREMLDSLLDDIGEQFLKTVSTARNIAAADLEQAISKGIVRPRQLVETGLANAVRGHEDVLAGLGSGTPVPTVSADDYADVTPRALGLGSGPAIAVVHASGAVGTGRSHPGGSGIGSRTIAEALADAAADTSIAAIVLRVASPGGSPAASDEIWLAVREAAKKKPVVASLGDVAASGGYYLASAADRIVAAPGTLTGSIGVVFFKPDVSGLLGRAGIHTETLSRGRFSRIFDLDRSLDDEELALVRGQLDDTYRLFLERVAAGRHRKAEEIDRVGGGRVWTGRQAFERGLVDELGTMEDAVRAAANAAGIHDSDRVKLVHFPRETGLADRLASLGASVSARMQPEAVTRLVGLVGDDAPALTLGPGVQAVAESVPTIE